MNSISALLARLDDLVWGPWMLVFLIGTSIYLTLRTHFLSWRNLGYAIKCTIGKDSRTTKKGTGDISPFSALTTALASTIGTGNIVGVATAMVAGGPGALIWMWLSAAVGMSTKFAECMLSIKYRCVNEKGEMSGGPMYTMRQVFPCKWIGRTLGWLFALFTVIASFGIGNMTQGNSISSALTIAFDIPNWITGGIITLLTLVIIVGGIKSISKVSEYLVPGMAILYMLVSLIVVLGNLNNLPAGIEMIFTMAFSPKAIGGGLCGSIVVSMMHAIRFGVSRGCFSHEAGMGAAGISAAAATTDSPVRQGYISMTGTFWDTIVMCTVTGLCIASSGMLGQLDPATGELYDGVALTMAAYHTVLGSFGAYSVCISIVLFAFSTIIGWEYNGEKALEYLLHTHRYNVVYRILYSCIVFLGATTSLQTVWNFSDIANALMCIPNLICLLFMSKEICRDMNDYQSVIHSQK